MNTAINTNRTIAAVAAIAVAATIVVSAQDVSFNVFDLAPGEQVVANQPYSAEMVSTTTQVLGDVTRIERSVTGKVYRDSAGRTRREQTIQGLAALTPTADEMTLVTITDPVARVTYTIDERNMTVRVARLRAGTFYWSSGAASIAGGGAGGRVGGGTAAGGARGRTGGTGGAADAGQTEAVRGEQLAQAAQALAARSRAVAVAGVRVGGPGQGTTEQLGTQIMEGLTVTGRRFTQTIPVGQIGNDRPIVITDERWESAELQVLVLSQHHDPRTGDVEYRLRNVSRVEPPADLFAIPPGYRVLQNPVFVERQAVPVQPQ